MSIFDIFSFKKDFAEVATAENFKALKDFAREKIIEQAKDKALKRSDSSFSFP